MIFLILMSTLIIGLRGDANDDELDALILQLWNKTECECVLDYQCSEGQKHNRNKRNEEYNTRLKHGKCLHQSYVCCSKEAILNVPVTLVPTTPKPPPATNAWCNGDAVRTCCEFPPPQQNGKFSHSPRRCPPGDTFNTHILCQTTPRSLVPHNWPIFHSCDPGFALNASNTVSVCLSGQWMPPLPSCVRLCSPLEKKPAEKEIWEDKEERVNLKCEYRDKNVSCENDMRPGTVARAECPQFYKTNLEMTCKDGSWAKLNQSLLTQTEMSANDSSGNVFRCVPECGVSTGVNTTSFGITELKSPSEYPWVAAIFAMVGDRWYLSQAGILVTPRYVLSDASHFTFTKPEEIRVGLGKIDNDFYRMQSSSIIVEVEKVIPHDKHNPKKDDMYVMNVALLRLLYDVHVSASIMPVCLHSKHGFNPAPGTAVTVTGWITINSSFWPPWKNINTHLKVTIANNKKCLPESLLNNTDLPGELVCFWDLPKNLDGYNNLDVITGSVITYQEEDRHFLKGFVLNFNTFIDVTYEPIFKWLVKTVAE